MSKESIKKIEDILYGSSDAGTAPTLPSPAELINILNLLSQPNLLAGAPWSSNTRNNITATGVYTSMASTDPSMYDDFNKHIRDYDGKRFVLSCDVDITFKDVNIPSSVSSIWVYVDQQVKIDGNSYMSWLVPSSDYGRYSVNITKMVKTGGSCTVHLSYEFTMTSKISQLGIVEPWLGINPNWVDGTKLVLDSHIYNVALNERAYY